MSEKGGQRSDGNAAWRLQQNWTSGHSNNAGRNWGTFHVIVQMAVAHKKMPQSG
jgi:hypothetical protein